MELIQIDQSDIVVTAAMPAWLYNTHVTNVKEGRKT